MKVLILGATGLIGKEVIARLEAHPSVSEVIALVRKASPDTGKVRFKVTDFSQLEEGDPCLTADVLISAIGTTMKKAGSEDAFRQVDHTIPLRVASLARRRGATQCFLVSALGADPDSRFFYNRIKGELEQDLRNLHFPKFVILRPSVLLGNRTEARPAEKIAQKWGRLLPKKWKSVPAENVAHAVVDGLLTLGPGEHILENKILLQAQ